MQIRRQNAASVRLPSARARARRREHGVSSARPRVATGGEGRPTVAASLLPGLVAELAHRREGRRRARRRVHLPQRREPQRLRRQHAQRRDVQYLSHVLRRFHRWRHGCVCRQLLSSTRDHHS